MFSSDIIKARRIAITAAVWASSSEKSMNLEEDFRKLLQYSLQKPYQENDNNEEEDNMSMDDDNDIDEIIWFDCLRKLQWLRRGNSFLGPLLIDIVHKTISDYIVENIGGEYENEEECMLPNVQEWNRIVVLPWIEQLVGSSEQSWLDWCKDHVLECFIRCRMDEMFGIIAEYPESHPAVSELASCLSRRPELYGPFAISLQQSLVRRLLHPGANTWQIIDVYINTIKVMRHIDPTDRLLQQIIAEAVQSYLRDRSNTVRCIITNLTYREAQLYQELQQHDAKPLEDTATGAASNSNSNIAGNNRVEEKAYGENNGSSNNDVDEDIDEDLEPDMDWRPPPPIRKQRAAFFDPSIGKKNNKQQQEQENADQEEDQLDILSIIPHYTSQ